MKIQLSGLVNVAVLGVALVIAAGCGSTAKEGKSETGTKFSYLYNQPTAAPTPNSIFGTWSHSETQTYGRLETRIRFEPNRIIFVNRCIFNDGGVTITVGVESNAVVDSNTISILESKNDQNSLGRGICQARIVQGNNTYKIVGTQFVSGGEGFGNPTKISD